MSETQAGDAHYTRSSVGCRAEQLLYDRGLSERCGGGPSCRLRRDPSRPFLQPRRRRRFPGVQPWRSGTADLGDIDAMNEELQSYVEAYLEEAAEISRRLSRTEITGIVGELIALRRGGGRLFIVGVGGSAANASHAVSDFRKIANIESYAPTDNVAELTARINDDGWDSSYAAWLKASRLVAKDALLVFSVGGGSEQKQVSINLVEAIRFAQSVG